MPVPACTSRCVAAAHRRVDGLAICYLPRPLGAPDGTHGGREQHLHGGGHVARLTGGPAPSGLIPRPAGCDVTGSRPRVASGLCHFLPLIPRSVLFGNPDRTSPALSPDGTLLGYVAPEDGVLNVWVRAA